MADEEVMESKSFLTEVLWIEELAGGGRLSTALARAQNLIRENNSI